MASSWKNCWMCFESIGVPLVTVLMILRDLVLHYVCIASFLMKSLTLRQSQRCLNPNIQEVVKKEIVKLLDVGIIYPISDSEWVSPVQVVLKKSGMTFIKNERDDLISTRTVTEWWMCIDYSRFNQATSKYHFPLPFIDQKLERLAMHSFFYYLDGYSSFFLDSCPSRWPREDDFHMPLWYLCLLKDAFWVM